LIYFSESSRFVRCAFITGNKDDFALLILFKKTTSLLPTQKCKGAFAQKQEMLVNKGSSEKSLFLEEEVGRCLREKPPLSGSSNLFLSDHP